jgi:CSLREA domain-containing protein
MTPQNAAMTLTVTKFTDSADGRCDADCSLREAITVANQAPGADTIMLLPGTYQLTIPLPMSGENTEEEDDIAIGDLDIADELYLRGAGVEATVLTSLINDRVIEVLPGASVRINDLTLTGGNSDHDGGGLLNSGELTLENVKVVANRAGSYDAGGAGGGIYNVGSLTLNATIVIDNFTSTSGSAGASGGGIDNHGTLDMVGGAIARNATSGSEDYSNGGGLHNHGIVTLRNVTVAENQTETGGGGIFNDVAGVMTLETVMLAGNYTTNSRGERGHGGGVHNAGQLTMMASRITSNALTNHSSTDSFGGGLYNRGVMNITQSAIDNNTTIGDHCHGGGLYNTGLLTVTNSTVADNIAGADGSNGDGGGLYSNGAGSRVALRNSTVYGNRSNNGGSGGGLWNSGGSVMTLVNTTLSGNRSTGNGGGINNTRTAGLLTILNSTLTDNAAAWSGGGIWNDEDSTLLYGNTIIAGNQAGGMADCDNQARLTSQGHNLLGVGTGCDASAPGDQMVDPATVFTQVLGPLALNAPGATATHALLPGSPALDAGDDTACPTTDQRGVARPQGPHCDIGAVEQGNADRLLFVSSTSSVIVSGIRANDEDILAYNRATGVWTLIFDGSDIGITGDVDAFAFLDNDALLLSLDAPATLPGIGAVDDSDIVQFTPTQLGTVTAGSFALWLDGSDVGLSDDAEDIDVIDFTPDGRLLVSPSDGFAVGALTGRDEDLFVLNNPRFGENSSGDWALYLDGSDVGVASGRDINGGWVDPITGAIYLSTNGAYTVAGLGGDEDDIFICTPVTLGADSRCTFQLYWNGDEVGFGSERLDGIDIAVLPASFKPAVITNAAPEPLEALDDEPWLEGPEEAEALLLRLFLPLIRQ